MILAQHEEEINIVRVGNSRDKAPVEDDLLYQAFCAEIAHESPQTCKQAGAPIGLPKPAESISDLIESRIMHPLREQTIMIERRDRHARINVARILPVITVSDPIQPSAGLGRIFISCADPVWAYGATTS